MFPPKTTAPSSKFPKSLPPFLAKTTELTTLLCPFQRLTRSNSVASATNHSATIWGQGDRKDAELRKLEWRNRNRRWPEARHGELNSRVPRARTAWDVGTAVRRASRAWVCSCVASRNSWPTSGTHISWIRASLCSRRAASIPHNGSSSQPSAYRATEPGCRQEARG